MTIRHKKDFALRRYLSSQKYPLFASFCNAKTFGGSSNIRIFVHEKKTPIPPAKPAKRPAATLFSFH
jgi:hypothetical protein